MIDEVAFKSMFGDFEDIYEIRRDDIKMYDHQNISSKISEDGGIKDEVD